LTAYAEIDLLRPRKIGDAVAMTKRACSSGGEVIAIGPIPDHATFAGAATRSVPVRVLNVIT
jgi:hypothetical protein